MSDTFDLTSVSSAALSASTWWAMKLCSPSFDNGDDSGLSGFAIMLAMMNARHDPDPTKEQMNKMVEVLAPVIDERLSRGYGLTLGVDYGPDPMLGDAADAAGISGNKFPWKTCMWINENYVTVSVGYHGRTVLVWASDEWLADRPVCTSQKYDNNKGRKDENYHGDPWSCSLPMYHTEDCKYDRPLELCKTCGRPDGWYHNPAERSIMPDFHTFVA